MSLLGSLTNRIFFGSALLAVGSIAIAIYNVNVAVTRQAEQELRRGLDEADTIIEEYRRVLVRALHARGAAHRRPAAAQGRGRYQRPEDGATHGRRLSPAVDRGPAARHGPPGADAGGDRIDQHRNRLLCIAARRQVGGDRTRVELFLAASGRDPADRVRAHLDRSATARNPRHAQRRRQPRQQRGEPLQVVDQQRNRLRR